MICCEHSARDILTTFFSPHTMIIIYPQAAVPRLPQTPVLPMSSVFSDTACGGETYDPIGRKYFLPQNSAILLETSVFDNNGEIATPASSAHISDALWTHTINGPEEYEYYLIPEFDDDTTWQAAETRESWFTERRNSVSLNRSRNHNLHLPLSPEEAADYGGHTVLNPRPQLAIPHSTPRSNRNDTHIIRHIVAWFNLHMRRHRSYSRHEAPANYTWSVGGSSINTRGRSMGARGSRENRSGQHAGRPRSRPRSRFGLWR